MVKKYDNRLVKHYAKLYWKKEFLCIGIIFLIVILSLIYPLLVQYLFDNILAKKELQKLIYFVISLFALNLSIACVTFVKKYIISIIENNIILDIRKEMFSNIIYQQLPFYKTKNVGIIMQKILGDVEVIRSLWGFLFPSITGDIFQFVITFIIILKINTVLALLSLLVIISYMLVFRLFNEKLRTLFTKIRSNMDQINAFVNEMWNGIKEVKIFLSEIKTIQKFTDILKIFSHNNISMTVQDELSSQLLNLITSFGSLIVLSLGGYYVIKGKMSIGQIVAVQMYISTLYSPAKDIADAAIDYKKYSAVTSRISEILYLDKKEECNYLNSKKFSNVSLKFQNVEFNYGKDNVLKNISFEMKTGKVYGLVGKSGQGKSTIINLILRFYSPLKGVISINNKELNEIPLNDIRKNVTIISQDAFLFNTSILDNICYGNPDATEDEINSVIKKLEIDKIVENMPDKLNTIVSEFGRNFSGGQVQRIAIARAILKNSSILIFDEATSAIDSETENLVQDLIDEMKNEKLIILISHRLSSIKLADEVFMLEDGKVVEHGKIDNLKENGQYFKSLFKEQLIKNTK